MQTISAAAPAHAEQGKAHSDAQLDRRSLLTAAAASVLAPALAAAPAAAEEAVATAPAVKELKGKAGFRFQYPDSWVTGFVSHLRHAPVAEGEVVRSSTARSRESQLPPYGGVTCTRLTRAAAQEASCTIERCVCNVYFSAEPGRPVGGACAGGRLQKFRHRQRAEGGPFAPQAAARDR